MNNIQTILIGAKQLLNDVGWTKGVCARDHQGRTLELAQYENNRDRVACFCLIGALGEANRRAGYSIDNYDNAYTVLMGSIVRDDVCSFGALSLFNDDNDTTLDHINATIDQAISKAL